MARSEHWPLFGLRITTERLELRAPDDDDLDELVELARLGIHDPTTMPFTLPWTDLPSPEFERSALQYWWRCRSDFSVARWDLAFAVTHRGRIIGVQNLTAEAFPQQRIAETGSWLGLAHQGQGFGTEMRRALLHLAFEHLDARTVTSAAFFDNHASQKVSLACGYEPTGSTTVLRRGEPAEHRHFAITRERWASLGEASPVGVTGFDRCRPLFGLDADGEADTPVDPEQPGAPRD